MIKGKSPEEIRKTFNITNDFTPRRRSRFAEKTSGLRIGKRRSFASRWIPTDLLWEVGSVYRTLYFHGVDLADGKCYLVLRVLSCFCEQH